MGGLQGQRYPHAERGQGDHRRSAHPDEHHLPEDRRDFEKLPGEWRDQDPIEQAEIKLEVVFQNGTSADAQNDKMAAPTKAEISARCRDVNPRSG
jgi:hypothetical protein